MTEQEKDELQKKILRISTLTCDAIVDMAKDYEIKIEKLQQQNARLKEALEKIANWKPCSPTTCNHCGSNCTNKIAEQVLKDCNG